IPSTQNILIKRTTYRLTWRKHLAYWTGYLLKSKNRMLDQKAGNTRYSTCLTMQFESEVQIS
ncbi:MAG: hypothetical protein KAR17_22340, partial [Cyclobacteriaceae bacterium]|nr:hypothetical protein [Cyclobacteriaceae bacterium]